MKFTIDTVNKTVEIDTCSSIKELSDFLTKNEMEDYTIVPTKVVYHSTSFLEEENRMRLRHPDGRWV